MIKITFNFSLILFMTILLVSCGPSAAELEQQRFKNENGLSAPNNAENIDFSGIVGKRNFNGDEYFVVHGYYGLINSYENI